MASVQLKNNASGTLASSITAGATSFDLSADDGANFPTLSGGNWFYITVQDTDGNYEIMKATARSSDTLTVTRAQESTAAAAFPAGSLVELRVTKQSILDTITANAVDTSTMNAAIAASVANYTLTTDLASTSLNKGASLIGVHDTGGIITATTVEAALAELETEINVIQGNYLTSASLGVSAQAYSLILTNIAALTLAANKLIYATGATSVATTDLSAFGITLIDDADAATARTTLGLGTMSTQAASAVAITGGTIGGVTSLQARSTLSSETTGTLTTLSANAIVQMTGDVLLNANVFSANDVTLFYTGAASRTFTQGSGVTMRLAGSSTTGTRAGAARSVIVGFWVSATEVVMTGGGVS